MSGITLRVHYSSVDPYMRRRIRTPGVKAYVPPFTLHTVIDGLGIGKIIKSDHELLREGDFVSSDLNIEEYSVYEKAQADGFKKIENPLSLDPMIFTSTLGMPGLMAYSSTTTLENPKRARRFPSPLPLAP